jgi:hypothetical protein
MRLATLLAVAALLGMTVSGCGDADGRLPVSGNISLKGAPVSEGTINFQSPDASVMTGGVIKDGKYAVAAEQGLKPGKYIVRISVAKPGTVAAEPLPGESGPPAEELVPPEYNAQSKLEFEVKDGVTNEFSFDVP